jgi:GT2 family glycosyltransferase
MSSENKSHKAVQSEEQLIISIVSWNSAKTIKACIESVLNQTFTDFKVLVIDNNSHDDTCAIVEQFKDERIHLFRQKENTGFCGGHNFAIANSLQEFVLLVNPDIIMDSRYIENALRTMKLDGRTGTVCGLLIQSGKEDPNCIIDSAGLEMSRSRVMRMKHHGEKLAATKLAIEEVFGADGALPLYRRSMINDISYNGQFFDNTFFAHKEDWDISWRARIYGWKTVFDPECIAIHPRHFKPKNLKLRGSIDKNIKVHTVKNQLLLLMKNETLSSFLANSIFIVPRQLAILVYVLLFERTSLKAYQFVLNNFHDIMRKRKVIQSRKKN